MAKVTNEWDVEINFEVAIQLMDDETREAVHRDVAPCTDQEFFDAYVVAHQERFDEEWELSKENPVY